MNRKRVLLISYHFPPVGGAGVQRPAKFAKYLPDHGWDVSVLQAENPSAPVMDESLLDDLPDDLMVVKARTLEPGYAFKADVPVASGRSSSPGAIIRKTMKGIASRVLLPDAQILWYPAARRAGASLLRRVPHDAILATAPSYSNLLLGASLSRLTGLPLIADFRDEWDLRGAYWENAARSSWSDRVQQWMQQRVLRQASGLIATTMASTSRLVMRAAEAGASPTTACIYNGWDADDITLAPAPSIRSSKVGAGSIRVVYTGTLWNLTSIAPLAAAFELLQHHDPEVLTRVELVVMGRKTPEQEALLSRISDLGVSVDSRPYAPHVEALETMRQADLLLLLLSDVPGAERVVPGKLFEYMAIGKPMLAVTPEGETADIVRSIDENAWRAASNSSGIADRLAQAVRGNLDRVLSPMYQESIRMYERRTLAGQLATLLNRVSEPRPT